MAVTLTNADKALKSYYLDAISEQLNDNLSPFFSAIEKTTNNVYGKEVRKLSIFGINGGIGAGTEDGDLPEAKGNNYAEIVSTLKNLYGVIEISDKAIRASENNSGAFVNLLNAEMDGLIKSSKINFSRMLFGNGDGYVATINSFDGDYFIIDDTSSVLEGMVIDVRQPNGKLISELSNRTISMVDRKELVVYISGDAVGAEVPEGSYLCIHGAYGNEITGLKEIFNTSSEYLYGLSKFEHSWLIPHTEEEVGEISVDKIQFVLDKVEEATGDQTNLIVCSWGVRRALQKLFASNRVVLDTMEVQGGYKTISYNGIPIVADRFCPKGAMYFLNTNDFALHQLCDWQWLADDDGKVLKQVPGKPVYTATLVKYAELICNRPCGQAALFGITEL
ncbi:MAG: phage major capsid protein [Clostridiales bacterium]|nr:phage major capsid protein [Clostridiales bacterium]